MSESSPHVIDISKTQISDDEAALYDRQIRLWGVEAQKKLRKSNILIAGINGLGSEICKNIVLSGVNSMTLLDHNPVSKYDATSNLFTHRQIGDNRAEASVKRVHSLNPMVNVNYECANIDDKTEDYFGNFHIVCLSGYGKETMIKVNNICNKLNVKFYGVGSWGMFGYGFVDLGRNYNYMTEEDNAKESVITIGTGIEEPIQKKPKIDEQIKCFTSKEIDFVTFESALSIKVGKPNIGLSTKHTPNVFIILHVMLQFYSKHSRFPLPVSRDADIKELEELQNNVLEHLGLDPVIFEKCKDWPENVFGEFSPICAIIGGVISQDIIRSVSGKDRPIRNFFLFNGLDYTGTIASIGKFEVIK